MALLGANLALLLAFGLGFALPLVDHHAVERNPWHEHVVLGGTALDERRALASHRHQYEVRHIHEQVAGEPLESGATLRQTARGAHVIAIQPMGAVIVSSLWSAGDAPVLPDLAIDLPGLAGPFPFFPLTLPPQDGLVSVVDPPPRA